MSVSDAPLNVALVGLGMVADTHLLAIADLKKQIHLQGIYARSAKTVGLFAEKAERLCGHSPRAYSSIQEIADDGSLDFSIVVTPPNARLEIVGPLAQAGIHILMEKPVERNSEAALQIVDLCEAHNIQLGIVFQHRVREASRKLAELVAAESFGALGFVEVAVPWWRDQAYYDAPGRGTYARDGGGVLISQAIHTLDLMLSLTGPVSEVQAMARTTIFHRMESEDFVTAGLTFENGAAGSLVASTASFPGDAESIALHYQKAVVILKSGVLNVIWRDGKTDVYGATAATGGGADPMAFTHAWHREIISDFADAIKSERAPMVSGREALKVHRLIDALVMSSKQKQRVTLAEIGAC